MGLLHHQFIVLCQLKSVWRKKFSGPGTIILKVHFLFINSTRKPLLIHAFSPINARLLTVYGTAFYVITLIQCRSAPTISKSTETLKFHTEQTLSA